MTVHGSSFYQAGLRCDRAGCQASIWRIEASRELAQTAVQAAAVAAGWSVAVDRLQESRDACAEHARERASAPVITKLARVLKR